MSGQTNFSNTNPNALNPAQQVGQQPGALGQQGTPNGANPNPEVGGGKQLSLEDALALAQQREMDINRLKSTYDRKLNETEQQHKTRIDALQRQMDEAITAKMDEAEKTKYNLQQANLRLEEIRAENTRLQQQQETFQNMISIRDQMIQSGIPADKLDMSSMEALSTSAWTYMVQDREEKARQLEELRSQMPQNNQQRQPQFQQPTQQFNQQQLQQQQFQPQRQQPVITNVSGNQAPQAATYDTLKQSYEAQLGRRVSDDDFLRAAELGKVDLSQIR